MYGSYWRYTLAAEHDSDDTLSALVYSAASAATLYTFTALEPMRVVRLGVLVPASVAGSGAITAAKYDVQLVSTYGGSGTQKMTVTVPSTATAGKVYYAENVPFDVNVGQQVIIGKPTQGTGASAGTCIPFIQVYKRAETDANQTYQVKVTS